MHMLPLAHGETPAGTTSLTPSPSVSATRQPCGSENTRPNAAYSASLVTTGLGSATAGTPAGTVTLISAAINRADNRLRDRISGSSRVRTHLCHHMRWCGLSYSTTARGGLGPAAVENYRFINTRTRTAVHASKGRGRRFRN